jgi:hypothetical protein
MKKPVAVGAAIADLHRLRCAGCDVFVSLHASGMSKEAIERWYSKDLPFPTIGTVCKCEIAEGCKAVYSADDPERAKELGIPPEWKDAVLSLDVTDWRPTNG